MTGIWQLLEESERIRADVRAQYAPGHFRPGHAIGVVPGWASGMDRDDLMSLCRHRAAERRPVGSVGPAVEDGGAAGRTAPAAGRSLGNAGDWAAHHQRKQALAEIAARVDDDLRTCPLQRLRAAGHEVAHGLYLIAVSNAPWYDRQRCGLVSMSIASGIQGTTRFRGSIDLSPAQWRAFYAAGVVGDHILRAAVMRCYPWARLSLYAYGLDDDLADASLWAGRELSTASAAWQEAQADAEAMLWPRERVVLVAAQELSETGHLSAARLWEIYLAGGL